MFQRAASAIGVVAGGAVAGLVVGSVFLALLASIQHHNHPGSAMHEDFPLARLVPWVHRGSSFVVVAVARAAIRLLPVNTLFCGGAWYCRLGLSTVRLSWPTDARS